MCFITLALFIPLTLFGKTATQIHYDKFTISAQRVIDNIICTYTHVHVILVIETVQ